jgi:hypothetical protein
MTNVSTETTKRIIVTVDDQHLPEIQAVATALQAAGMQVDQILPSTGIITGEVSPAQMSGLKTVPGVVDVALDQEMRALS